MKNATLLILLALIVPGCAHAPEPREAAASRAASGAQVVYANREPLPEALAPWLADAIAAIATRNPSDALPFFDPENRATQREFGIADDAQYVVEGLGVARDGHVAGPQLMSPIDYFAVLRGLERIVVLGVMPLTDANGSVIAGWQVVVGELRFSDGMRYRMRLQVRQTETGWTVAPAVG